MGSVSTCKRAKLNLTTLCLSAILALCPSYADAFSVAVYDAAAKVESPAVVINKTKFETLRNYDVLVFIDASNSMKVGDCDDGRSTRWQWCQEQTIALRNALAKPMNGHLKMVAFSDKFTVYPNVEMDSIPSFFAEHKPSGSTDITRAIKSQLNQYFASRKADKNTRPLLIAMITDGLPDRPQSLSNAIVQATQQMDDPKEIAITFLQVGTDVKATRYLQELDECLISRNARYDIVTTKTYDQLSGGLADALLQSVIPETVAFK